MDRDKERQGRQAETVSKGDRRRGRRKERETEGQRDSATERQKLKLQNMKSQRKGGDKRRHVGGRASG